MQLTLRGYRRAGGVADAVNRGAQAAYDALTRSQQDAARLVFTQLTVITAGGQFARRRCRRADLSSQRTQTAEDIDAVIGVFSARRLLVLGEDRVEIAHDALLHAWKQLRDWLGDDQFDRALYSQVVTDAATWDTNGRDSAYLYRPGRLATIDAAAARWQGAAARYPPLPATSEAFLGAAHHAARHATRRQRGVIAGLLALTVIAISAAGIAVRGAANASRQHAIALSRQLASESLAADSTNPLTARQLAVAAWSVFPTDQAGSAVASLLMEQQQGGILPGNAANSGATAVAFSPDGKLLATAYGDGYVRLWNPATQQAVGSPLPADTSPGGFVYGVAFSPDGKLLATAGVHGIVRLWNPATQQAVGAPIPAGTDVEGVSSMAFSPDGKLLATAGVDGTVRLWNPATGQAAGAPLPNVTSGGLNGVAFSPDGKLLATADSAGYLRLWNAATRQPVGAPLLAVTNGGLNGVAFSPDGKLLATADVRRHRAAVEPGHPAGRRRSPPGCHRLGGRRERGGVQPGRQAAGQRRRRRHRAAVEPGHPAGRRRSPPGCHRLGGRRERGGVQPGRQAAGQRRRRRHRAAVEPGHPAGSPRSPPARHRRRERGGVQPGRQAAGRRRPRRHCAAVGSGYPAARWRPPGRNRPGEPR